jgi:hypothetical protein
MAVKLRLRGLKENVFCAGEGIYSTSRPTIDKHCLRHSASLRCRLSIRVAILPFYLP